MSNFRLEDEFISRTKKNLELVLMHPELEFNEITQFMNSMVGLLIFPKEVFFNRIRSLSLDKFEENHWPKPEIILWMGVGSDDPSFKNQRINLRQIIIAMRNSVSHASFNFESTGQEIEKVTFIDKDRKNVTKRTKITFGTVDLKEFILRFADEMLQANNYQRNITQLGL